MEYDLGKTQVLKGLTGNKFSKYLPKFHSIRYFVAVNNTKQQDQLG